MNLRLLLPVSALAVIIVLSPVTSAAQASFSPPYKLTAPFGTHGSRAFNGTLSAASRGSCTDTIVTPPRFTPSNGSENQSTQSRSSGGGYCGVEVWAGLQNLTFYCNARCASTSPTTVRATWVVSWNYYVSSTCGNGRAGVTGAYELRASLVLDDVTNAPSRLVEERNTTITKVVLHGVLAGRGNPGNATKVVYLDLKTTLVAGHTYVLDTYLTSSTYAHSSGLCSSAAVLGVDGAPSVPFPTALRSIHVG